VRLVALELAEEVELVDGATQVLAEKKIALSERVSLYMPLF
jgi:hypothetical protein